jgi:hypothetical protein
MTTALAPRRMLLSFLVAAAALLFVGAGHALAAQRPSVAHRATTVHHHPVAYADGTLTLARQHAAKRPVGRTNVCTMMVATREPVAYADGLLTHPRRHHQRRRILAHTA